MRLQVCLLALLIVLAGCTKSEDTTHVEEDRKTIPAGEHDATEFGINPPAVLEVSVQVHGGPAVDVLALDRIQWQAYIQGANVVPIEGCSGVADPAFVGSCTIKKDRLYMVIDNSDAGDATPGGNTTADAADVSWAYSFEVA